MRLCEERRTNSEQCYAAGVISTYVSVFRQRNGTRASQYLPSIARRTRAALSFGRMRAVAANSGPVIFPRIVQGAILTCALFRIRFTWPNLLFVMKTGLSPSSANQMGVGTASPVLCKVAREMYFCPWIAAGMAMGIL